MDTKEEGRTAKDAKSAKGARTRKQRPRILSSWTWNRPGPSHSAFAATHFGRGWPGPLPAG